MRASAIVGEVFGETTVIERYSPRQVVCKCSCGKSHIARIDHLKKGQKSCGCKRKRLTGKLNWKYKDELHHAVFGERLSFWRHGAKVRNLPFNITIEDLDDIWKEQSGRCFYTNRKLSLEKNQIDTVSIERINSELGYELGNVVFVSKTVNMMKKNYLLAEFINVCRDVSKHMEDDRESFNEAV